MAPWGTAEYLKILFFFNLCVLFFQMATKLFGLIVIKSFGPNHLINGSVRYLFWPRGTVKKLPRH